MHKPKKTKPLPRFEMRAEFVADFPAAAQSLRFVVCAEGEHMEELREISRYRAKLKMEMLGLAPRGIERDDYELFALKTTKQRAGAFLVVDRVPAVYGEDLATAAGKKALKARAVVPENHTEALALYSDEQAARSEE